MLPFPSATTTQTFESGGKVSKNKDSAPVVDGFLKGEYRDVDFGKVSAEVWTNGKAKSSLTVDKLAKDVKVIGKANSGPANRCGHPNGILGVEYTKPLFTTTAEVDYCNSRAAVNLSGSYKFDNLAVGGSAELSAYGHKDNSEIFRNYSVGVRYHNPSYCLVLQSQDNGPFASGKQTTSLGYLFHSKQNYKVGAQYKFQGPGESSLEVGTLYETRDKAKFRVKANDAGVVTTSYSTRLNNPNVQVSATVQSSVSDFKAHKTGLKLVF